LSVKKRGGGHAGGDAGARGLTVKVKKAKKLKPSSVRWLQRQLNDPYGAEGRVSVARGL